MGAYAPKIAPPLHVKKKMLNRFCLNYHRIFLIYSGSERLVNNFLICCFFYPIKYGLRQVSLKKKEKEVIETFVYVMSVFL